ncbi:sigma-E factor regulatory protein RseB domain-containing protein [Virgibacillus sp. C22-A2]|uniref:Sigma-E factor regulatory protein RseB domain-containing protein n=1 Tax=Virgibacillus tibetensis TaxID=3042313 RepID=A0ABU6KHH3_9BACI|nr:sigma-E factor regulatory protein RseB domain-containing protein [Virgibacillus sp. C22-A2]
MSAGCSSESSNNYSPEQLINHALEEGNLPSYYAESTTITSTDGEEIDQMIMKEWRSEDGKIRVEIENQDGGDKSIAVNDGQSIKTYQMEQNQVIVIDDPELVDFNQPSPKDQANFILDVIRDTHDISTKGDEEIAGRLTYHLVADPHEENTLFGKQELWIDKENWLVLKMISTTGDQKSESVYTKVDFKAKIPAGKFALDLPEDVEVKNLNDFNNSQEVTLEEARKGLEKPFLYFPETDGLEISGIEQNDLTGIINRTEVTIDYKKNDVPLLSLAVFETPEETEEAFSFPGEEAVTVRGHDGSFTDTDGFRALLWQEDGLSYSLIIVDPNITLEDLQQLTETMERIE